MTGKVLVVDDVEQNVKLLEAKLQSEYYTVFSTYSGMECLGQVKDVSPDIILLDVMMPEMDGFETCRRLKSDKETAHIPVVMVTALSEKEDRVQGLEAGANDFITKPIDEVHLFARVKSLIRYKIMLDELRMRDKTGSQFGLIDDSGLIYDEVAGKILVIDDDLVQSRNIEEVLTKEGHEVKVEDHANATDIVAQEDFDLVIINTMLDDADGLRLGVEIRSQEKNKHVPIMILVDEDEKAILVKGLEIGIDDYVMTPMDNNELIARVRTQIIRKSYQDSLKSNYQERLSAAVIDSLTKLHNRRYLDAHLSNIVGEALEKKSDLSVMTIDIDHFKSINDKPGWGHHVGDEVLIELAKRMKKTIRTTDLAARQGGEEFVVVMPNTTEPIGVAAAERMRAAMSNAPFKISAAPGEVDCTVSIGFASLRKDGDTVEDLLKRSDEALYEAKESGRNKVIIAPK